MQSKEYLNGYKAVIDEMQSLLSEAVVKQNKMIEETTNSIKVDLVSCDLDGAINKISENQTKLLGITRLISLMEHKYCKLLDQE